jgi:hypothetical protein
MNLLSRSTRFILAVSAVATASFAQVPETLDATRLKSEAATLSSAGRQAFREALLACASYHEHYRDVALELQCERQINIFNFDFAESDSRITLFLESVMKMARTDANLNESTPARGKTQKRTRRGQYFLDQLVRAYRESKP